VSAEGSTGRRHLPDQAFPFLNLAERDRLVVHGREQHVPAGESIIRERHHSRAIYVLLEGRVVVEKHHLGVVDELRPGAIFGEVSFLEGSPASASIVAYDDVDVFVLDELDELLGSDLGLASGFYRSLATLLARRLRFTTDDHVTAALVRKR
jgi:extracellular factor (EF) 3-hydroxypalmitic acid methyl ester biosynthesis protein